MLTIVAQSHQHSPTHRRKLDERLKQLRDDRHRVLVDAAVDERQEARRLRNEVHRLDVVGLFAQVVLQTLVLTVAHAREHAQHQLDVAVVLLVHVVAHVVLLERRQHRLLVVLVVVVLQGEVRVIITFKHWLRSEVLF